MNTNLTQIGKTGLSRIEHGGQTYWATGKTGTHIASGAATVEMEAQDGSRLWATMDGLQIFQD